jgi:hypothetical protein
VGDSPQAPEAIQDHSGNKRTASGLIDSSDRPRIGRDRETVARHIRLSRGAGSDSKAAIAPIGSEPEKCGFESSGAPGRRSEREQFRELIAGKLDQGLSAQRIDQDLVVEHSFAGSYYSVRRFVRRLSGGPTPLPS